MVNAYNPLLITDFYKTTHAEMYPRGLTKMVSYYTPRMSRLKDTDKVTMFGLQAFIQEYLIDTFNHWFFNQNEREVIYEYERVLNATLGKGSYDSRKIIDLHRLGYLPLEISAVPEGTRTVIGVPQIQITNTHPNFVWLVNAIETMLSCSMWHTQVSAEVGYRYWQIVKKYWEKTCDESINPRRLLGDFSMRGQQSVESAIKSSAGWLLSFHNSATVPAIMWLEDYYDCDCTKEDVGYGAISTEHSVMCSNYAVDGDEITHIKRLLTEIYPNHNFSMVSDSYDYWNLVTNILPQCHEAIMNHNGCLSIRGDSGDPVEVIAGKDFIRITQAGVDTLFDSNKIDDFMEKYCFGREDQFDTYFRHDDRVYKVTAIPEWNSEHTEYTSNECYFIDHWDYDVYEVPMTAELMGTVWALWQEFGGTTNSKGYKVLDPHIKAIYGDSITPQRCEEIYRRLMNQGFAINNVSLGVGSFSMMCLETIDNDTVNYNPYTRDTFGIAVKATYAEDASGKLIMIYKQPKALAWKKSQKGCCWVNPNGIEYTDGLTSADLNYVKLGYTIKDEDDNIIAVGPNLIRPVFRNGAFVKRYTLNEVRKNMYPNEEI